AGIPGVLLRAESGHIEWIHSQGRTIVPAELGAFLPHPPELREALARDLVEFCSQENAGDLIVLGWGRDGTSYSFINERGAHAGPGPAFHHPSSRDDLQCPWLPRHGRTHLAQSHRPHHRTIRPRHRGLAGTRL